MSKCIHVCVCGFKVKDFDDESVCTATEICKYFAVAAGGGKAVVKKSEKRKYTHHVKTDKKEKENFDAPIEDCSITKKQILVARVKIHNADQAGKINENQKAALESLKGIGFKSLSAAQKEQIMNIAKDLGKGE